jgi:hypothetical protein
MDWAKSKINELTLTAAIGLAALQVVTPMFIDMMFDGLIIGLMWVAAKTAK